VKQHTQGEVGIVVSVCGKFHSISSSVKTLKIG